MRPGDRLAQELGPSYNWLEQKLKTTNPEVQPTQLPQHQSIPSTEPRTTTSYPTYMAYSTPQYVQQSIPQTDTSYSSLPQQTEDNIPNAISEIGDHSSITTSTTQNIQYVSRDNTAYSSSCVDTETTAPALSQKCDVLGENKLYFQQKI